MYNREGDRKESNTMLFLKNAQYEIALSEFEIYFIICETSDLFYHHINIKMVVGVVCVCLCLYVFKSKQSIEYLLLRKINLVMI